MKRKYVQGERKENSIEDISFCIINTNLKHYLSSVYFVNQPLHVSGIFIAHHQEVYCIYTTLVCVVLFS